MAVDFAWFYNRRGKILLMNGIGEGLAFKTKP